MLKRSVLGLLFALFSACLMAADYFKEGKHYQQVPFEPESNPLLSELKAEHPKKVIVLEFFSYGCHWCRELDPRVHQWLQKDKANYVVFVRVPVVFQNAWVNLSKAYYTAQSLNVLDKIHTPFFDAIQTNKIPSSSKSAIEAFFMAHGVNKDAFNKTFGSFSIDQKFKQANDLSLAFKITSIPTFIVQGAEGAYITSTRMAGSDKALFDVIDSLAEEEYNAMPKRKR